jgi:hypothetical protein
MPHEASQTTLPAACFGQAGKADTAAGAGRKGIHTSNTLNKMADRRFTLGSFAVQSP